MQLKHFAFDAERVEVLLFAEQTEDAPVRLTGSLLFV